MSRDIEEFLKQAAARRQQPPRRRPPVQRAADQEIEIIEVRDDVEPRQSSVRQIVSPHIDTSDIAQHTEQLGQRIVDAKDVVESRMSQRFEHRVGQLKGESAALAQTTSVDRSSSVSAAANNLLQMFRNPTSVRQIILLAEILKRPDFD